MSFRPLWPAMPPPCLRRATPGAKSSSSCTMRTSSGLILKNPASICTGRPLAFMKVCGRSSEPPAQRLELGVLAQHDAVRRGKALHQPEASVVPRALVLLARVAQADYQSYAQALFLLFF